MHMHIPVLYKFAKIFTNYMEKSCPYLKKKKKHSYPPPSPRPNPRLNDSGHSV